MTQRQGLVPVQKLVSRGGRTFTTTVWVRPGDKPKVQTATQVQIPDWNFKDVAAFETEIARINKIKDPSEKKVLKEQLLADLKKNGISFKEDNGTKADAVNWMRALMSAKKHLKAGNSLDMTKNASNSQQTVQPTKPSQSTQPTKPAQQAQQPSGAGKVVLGTGQNMSKEDAKKAVSDLRGQIGTQGVMDLAEKNGIQWAKNANNIANSYMQCAMKLSKHLQNGGTLTDDGKSAPKADSKKDAAPVVKPDNKKDKKDEKKAEPKLDPKSIEYDWYNAPKKFKMIGMITGILPTDEKAHEYLDGLIKAGKFDLEASTYKGYAISRGQKLAVDKAVGAINSPTNKLTQLGKPEYAKGMFKGTAYEKDFKEFKKTYDSYNNAYGLDSMINGVVGIKKELDKVKLFTTVLGTKDFSDVTRQQALHKLVNYVEKISNNPTQAEEFWDKNQLSKSLKDGIDFNEETTFRDMFKMLGESSGNKEWSALRTEISRAAGDMGQINVLLLQENVEKGTITKQNALKIVAKGLQTYQARNGDEFKATKIVDKYDKYYESSVFNRISRDGNTTYDGFLKETHKALTLLEKMSTDDAQFIKVNLALRLHSDLNMGNSGPITDWQPVDKELYDKARDKREVLEQHIWLLKKTAPNREKWIAKEKQANKNKMVAIDYLAEYKKNTDAETLLFPEHDDAREEIRASLETVPAAEAKKVESNIQKSHDKSNHRSFKTVVHGVYRIKNLPYEKTFQKIDKDRNNTDYYYHGTGYRASQKIIGQSGQFVVSKTNVKAGRMLGDGVYLANNSSKSMQYASDDYGRNSARGVLYLCEASLGKVVTSTTRGSAHNGQLLNRKSVDTVFMDKPHVLNPEWSVKEEKAVIPRLWIDVERRNV